MIKPASNRSRAMYNALLEKYTKERYPQRIITDGYLMLMKSIQGTPTNVIFDVLVNQSSGTVATNIERRLNITDRFNVSDMSICLMKAGSSTTATQAEISVARPDTYPNPNVFTAANEASNLESVYNGSLNVTIDSTVYYQALELRRFYRVPTSQAGTAVSTVAITGVIQRDGWDNLNYAFSPVTPDFEFSGIGNNQVTVNLSPSAIDLSGTSSQNFLVIYFRGFLIQNVNQRS